MKDKDVDGEKSPKTVNDDTLDQTASVKQEIGKGKEALIDMDTKDSKTVVLDEAVLTKIKEEPMEGNVAIKDAVESTSEKNSGPLPSEHTGEVKKKSDEMQKALKNDQQAKIPLKKREMKRSEDFDPANCGSGGSNIIVRNPAVKEARIAGEENGPCGENLNGNVSPAGAVEGDGRQPSDSLQIKQEESRASSKERQTDAEGTETKMQLSDTKKEEHKEKQKVEQAPVDKNQTIKEESTEMDGTAVSKDQVMSSKPEEVAQRSEKSSECEAIPSRGDSEKAAESVKVEVAEDCSKPLDKETPEKCSVTKFTNQAEGEKKPEPLKETSCPNEKAMDHKRNETKHEPDLKKDPASNEYANPAADDKTQMETETSTSQDSKKQSDAPEQSIPADQKAGEPCKSEETKSPVDETSTSLKDCALLEEGKKPESGSPKPPENQELPEEETVPDKNGREESEPLNEVKKLPEDSDIIKPKENVTTEDCEKSINTEPAAEESHDGKPDNSTVQQASKGMDSESADREKQDAVMKTEKPPSPAEIKTEEVATEDKAMELGSGDTEDNKAPTDKTEGTEENVDDKNPPKEACGEEGMQSERPVEETKASAEDSSKDRKENGDQKGTSEKEVSLGGDLPGHQNRATEKEKTSKGDADVTPEAPPQGIRLKIRVPAHRRRVELQREEGKGDSESEATEGRCLRRSPRICRPTAKLAEIQDRKVEKKQVTPAVEKEKEANEEKEGEENAVQKKPREKKVDQEGQAKPKVCVNMLVC